MESVTIWSSRMGSGLYPALRRENVSKVENPEDWDRCYFSELPGIKLYLLKESSWFCSYCLLFILFDWLPLL